MARWIQNTIVCDCARFMMHIRHLRAIVRFLKRGFKYIWGERNTASRCDMQDIETLFIGWIFNV